MLNDSNVCRTTWGHMAGFPEHLLGKSSVTDSGHILENEERLVR